MSQHPQQEVHLMKSLVIYVWGRLGGKNLGPTHSGFQEVGPLAQKEKGDRKRIQTQAAAPCQPSTTHKSHMANQTKPLTHAVSLEAVVRTTLGFIPPVPRVGPYHPLPVSSALSRFTLSQLFHTSSSMKHRSPPPPPSCGHQALPAAPLFGPRVSLPVGCVCSHWDFCRCCADAEN